MFLYLSSKMAESIVWKFQVGSTCAQANVKTIAICRVTGNAVRSRDPRPGVGVSVVRKTGRRLERCSGRRPDGPWDTSRA